MIRVLVVALASATIGVGCPDPAGESAAHPLYDELFGEVVEVVPSSDTEVIVSLRTESETIWLPAGAKTYISVDGVEIPPVELVDYVGFSAVILCQRQGEVCRDVRFIGLEPRPRRGNL